MCYDFCSSYLSTTTSTLYKLTPMSIITTIITVAMAKKIILNLMMIAIMVMIKIIFYLGML